MGIATVIARVRSLIEATPPKTWQSLGFACPRNALGLEPLDWISDGVRATRDCHLEITTPPNLDESYCREICELTLRVAYRRTEPDDLLLVVILEDAARLSRALALPLGGWSGADSLRLGPPSVDTLDADDAPWLALLSVPITLIYVEDT